MVRDCIDVFNTGVIVVPGSTVYILLVNVAHGDMLMVEHGNLVVI